MILRAVDLETSGLDPAKDFPVEIGWCDLVCESGVWTFGRPTSRYIRPPDGARIPPESQAVHHILDEDVAGASSFGEVLEEVMAGAPHCYVAHRAEFEKGFADLGQFICTWRVAVTMAPNAPAHNLGCLRHWLKLDVDRSIADQSHRAGPDAYVCAALVARMLNSNKMSVEQMLKVSENPVILPKLFFGVHVGKPMADVPSSYLEWMLKQETMDRDALHTAFHELQRRREEANGTEG